MNQIPNIEETNTKEVEEIIKEFERRMPLITSHGLLLEARLTPTNYQKMKDWLRTTHHQQLQKAREEQVSNIIADYMEALGTVQLPQEVWLWIADINGKYLNKTLKENI